MTNPTELKKARERAYENYQRLRKDLENPSELASFSSIAQAANDAWLEFKKLDTEFSNYAILKKMGDLYGC